MSRSSLKKANDFYANGEYAKALELYRDVLNSENAIKKHILPNINRCEALLGLERTKQIPNQGQGLNSNLIKYGSTVLFVSHDFSRTGAPAVLAKVIKWLKEIKGIKPLIIYGGGFDDRYAEFTSLGECHHVLDSKNESRHALKVFLKRKQIDAVYANTVASGSMMESVYNILGSEILYIAHVHEKQSVIKEFEAETQYMCSVATKIITVSRDTIGLLRSWSPAKTEICYIPPFIDEIICDTVVKEIPVIWGCGTIETRKGFDLFCESLSKLREICKRPFEAGWIGPSANKDEPQKSIDKHSLNGVVKHYGLQDDPRSFYSEGDIFFLSSREEPFSLASLEAAEMGLPIVSYDESCAPGMCAFIRKNGCGLIANALDTDDSAHCLKLLLENKEMARKMGQYGMDAVHKNYTTDVVMPRIYKYLSSSDRAFGRRKLIIVSQGPAPVFGIKTLEGGGLRCWGLANGLALSNLDIEVYLTFPRCYLNTESPGKVGNISIYTWAHEEDVVQQINDKDIVISSYCFGALSTRISESIRPLQTFILDCYVPIHTEVCARNSSDLIRECKSYTSDSSHWQRALMRGDFYLCANESQKSYYYGLLCGLGKINPISYKNSNNIIVAPFGIYNEKLGSPSGFPISAIVKPNAFKLLWFGGVYPWFKIENLIFAVESLISKGFNIELVIVGAKNPFNTHPDFVSVSERVLSLSKSDPFCKFIHVIDWVPYSERFDWYRDSDLVVTFNQTGIENRFSWRTRLLDYLECDAIFVTNGGDPIGDLLIDIGLGYQVSNESVGELADGLIAVIDCIRNNSTETRINKHRLDKLKTELTWQNIGSKIMSSVKGR